MLAVTSETEAGITGPKITHPFKGCVCYDLASLFFSVERRALVELAEKFFSLQKLFQLSRKSKLEISDIQLSCRHQMSKHKTRNTIY